MALRQKQDRLVDTNSNLLRLVKRRAS
jgi:hypothetical protein